MPSTSPKKLVIVESPAKAKTISKYLGSDYIVRASVGHVRDLPKNNKKAIDIEKNFTPHYEMLAAKADVVADLRKLAKNAKEVLLATDPDREGEAIAWHVAELLDAPNIKRVVFHEITKDAVQRAVEHPRDIDHDLLRAQEARRVLDRLVGYDLSGLIWKKVRYGLSAGRVQSPALRIIMEREREIRAFVPEDYWVLSVDVKNTADDAFTLICSKEPRKEDEAKNVLEIAQREQWLVTDLKETQTKRSPRAPFITSTLQQTASSRLGFSPSRTMRAAQKLYEAGLITYMRTDSTTLSKEALGKTARMIEKEYGKDQLSFRTYKTKSKNAQEAHEAIRPTDPMKMNAGAALDEKKLYRLIWQRTIASQMVDAQLLKTKIIGNVQSGNIPDFSVNGSRLLSPGWLAADPESRGEDVELPKVAVGEKLTLIEVHSEKKQTQPPSRYTEAGLVKELEKRGIGRPSTYASIISTLVTRNYVEKEGKTLHPTSTGDVVSTFLEGNFDNIISDSFTADMEAKLDEIATGDREYAKTLADFYTPFTKQVASKENIDKLTTLGEAPKEFKCPKCGSDMVYKLGRGGKFMSCDRFPDCDGARTEEGAEIRPDEPIGQHPDTGEDIYLLTGRFGPYVQIGEKTKENPKPKRASVPKDKDLTELTIADAAKYLSLPRELGTHPQTGETITASIGRFGPFIVHDGDFRSLKAKDNDDPYTITLDRALEILSQEKKTRKKAAAKTPTKKKAPAKKTPAKKKTVKKKAAVKKTTSRKKAEK